MTLNAAFFAMLQRLILHVEKLHGGSHILTLGSTWMRRTSKMITHCNTSLHCCEYARYIGIHYLAKDNELASWT